MFRILFFFFNFIQLFVYLIVLVYILLCNRIDFLLSNNLFARGDFMAIKMLVFDYRESEKEFFGTHELNNFEITFFNESLNDETVAELPKEILNNTNVISVFVNSEVSENVINAFKNLRIISTRSTGVEHINLRAAEDKNISVINVEGYGAVPVAQYTFGLLLALVRHIFFAANSLSDGDNIFTNFVGRDLSNLTLGVIGTGSVGVSVCKIAKSFGMKILAYDIVEKQEVVKNYGITYVELDTLLKESDVVTLHLPYTDKSSYMMNFEQFKIMKKSAYLINTSSAKIVNMKDLYKALKENLISGAALDIVICEDANYKCANLSKNLKNGLGCFKETEAINLLSKMPNVIITPHIAYNTQEAINYILKVTFISIIECIKGGDLNKIS